jgi:TolB-like protein/Tfp pilus assembly protein PilF
VVNLCSDDVGNRQRPQKFQALRKKRARLRWAEVAAALLLLAGIAAAFVLVSKKSARSVSVTPEKSIAVLPFENLSDDKANAYFAEGIQDEILTRLAGIADLKVISRTSTQRYQSKPGNLPEIAKQLGIANILEGSVQKVADQVRVNVQLINAQTDSHLWADTYDRKMSDIFGVESEIAKRIAESLQAKLTGREKQTLAVKPTNNPEAYDAYLRGVAFEARNYSSSYSADLKRKAVDSFQRAVQLDPKFAFAWARLSRANAFLCFNGDFGATPAQCDAAKRALENAGKLEPNSPEALLALGYYQYYALRDYGLAKTTFKQVGKLLPGSSEVTTALAYIARREGEWNESIACFEQALALDPRNMEVLDEAALTYCMVRQFPAALKLYDRALDITPNDLEIVANKANIYQAQGNLQEAAKLLSGINEQTPSNGMFSAKVIQLRLERNYGEAIRLLKARGAQFHFNSDFEKVDHYVYLAFIQRLAGDTSGAKAIAEQARNTLEQLHKDQPDNLTFVEVLSLADAALGAKDLALKEAEHAIMLWPSAKDRVLGPVLEEKLALIQTIFGENDRAISTLTQLSQTPYRGWVNGGMPVTPALLRLDPVWDPLRGDPRFEALVQNVSSPKDTQAESAKSIAVLPFENLSHDPDNAYFAEGIQEEILTRLAKIADLKVISRTSTQQYQSKPGNLSEIAKQLGVGTILEGSVQKVADQVRVNVQLINAQTDSHLWAETFDRKATDIFGVESEIAKGIAESLQAKLSPAQANALAAIPTHDAEAYDLFLKGEYQARQAVSAEKPELFDRAEASYRQALARDPNFALAYARLATTRMQQHWFVNRLNSAQLEEVESNIKRALAIAPDLPEAYLALGVFHYWGYLDYDSALRALDRAIELQPSNSDSRSFRAAVYRRRGEWRRSIAESERAVELNPRDSYTYTDVGDTYLMLRRWSEAERALSRAVALDPHNINAGYHLAQTYVNSTGDISRARQAWEGIPDTRTGFSPYGIVISQMIRETVYLDVLERRFVDALKVWDTVPTNTPDARLRQLDARIGIQMLAGQNGPAKSEGEQARPLLEVRLAERTPQDRTSLTESAWVYVCLGRNADALRIAREATEAMPIEKDAIVGANFLTGLVQIDAHVGRSEEAVKILRRLLTIPAGEYISVTRLKIDPVWDPIRNDPGFQKLLSEPEPETVYK